VCLFVSILVIFAFFIPLQHWEEMKRNRKKLEIPITKWEYFQEFVGVVLIPLILMGLGVLYLIDLLNLEF
jgi:hypothetical protein